MNDIDNTLAERGSRYGKFSDCAEISQSLKDLMRKTSGWQRLSYAQREGLEMIQHKIARMLNGDPSYLDNIIDIVGYSRLVQESMEGVHGIQEKVAQ